jgi:hypothetical protein
MTKLIFEHFKNLDALLTAVNTRPLNAVYKTRKDRLASEYTGYSATRDTKTINYNESVEIMKKGYSEPLKQIKQGIAKMNRDNMGEKKRVKADVVGFMPIVPNAIIGLPKTMLNVKKQPQKQKMINLVYGFSALGNVSADKLLKGGILFLSLVNQLEKEGYRIKIDLLRCTTASEQDAIAYTVTVKEYSQPLNLLKLCYPLVHPSMLRRTSFRWCETLPDLKNTVYANGYGASLYARMDEDAKKELKFLTDNKMLKKDQIYCNVYQCFESNSIEELKSKIGLK